MSGEYASAKNNHCQNLNYHLSAFGVYVWFSADRAKKKKKLKRQIVPMRAVVIVVGTVFFPFLSFRLFGVNNLRANESHR